MIYTILFRQFLIDNFPEHIVRLTDFGINFQAEIDCLVDKESILVVECSVDAIRIDSILKKPILDFSLYKCSFFDNSEGERLIKVIKQCGCLT